MQVIVTKIGPIGIEVVESPDDGGWYGEVISPVGKTLHTTKILHTEGEAGRAAVAAVPKVVEALGTKGGET